MYIKAKGIAFPAYISPYQDIQLALQKDSDMRLVKSLYDTFKYDCKISAECPWLKGNDKDYDDELDSVYM